MRAYSTDLRERIVTTVKHDGKTPKQAAATFKISPASVHRYLQLERDLHDLTPLKSTGRKRNIGPDLEPLLLEQLNAHNDATLEEHCQLWKKATGMIVSITCMHQSLERARVTLKKNDARPRAQ